MLLFCLWKNWLKYDNSHIPASLVVKVLASAGQFGGKYHIKNNFNEDSLNGAVDPRNKSAFYKNQSACVGVDSKMQKQTSKNHI